VQHVPIDIDELAAIGALRHQMGLPDFLEQREGHEVVAFARDHALPSRRLGRRHGILGGPTVEGKLSGNPLHPHA